LILSVWTSTSSFEFELRRDELIIRRVFEPGTAVFRPDDQSPG
jgi:hypothetical protein